MPGEDEGPPGGATLHSILVDPRDPTHLYIGISMGGVFESRDGGKDWTPVNKGCAVEFLPMLDPEYGHDPHCVQLHPVMPDRLYQQNQSFPPVDQFQVLDFDAIEEIAEVGYRFTLQKIEELQHAKTSSDAGP